MVGHPTASYFKITKEDKILPMYEGTTDFSDLKNKSYAFVKKKLKEKL